MSTDGDEASSTVSAAIRPADRHSYPPATASSPVAGADGGEADIKSNSNCNSAGLVRPSTRASSYATANDSENEESPGSCLSGDAHGPQPDTAASPGRRAGEGDDADEDEHAYDNAERGDGIDSPDTLAESTAMTPAAQLRLSLARRLWSGVTQLRSRSRCALLFQGAFTVAQVAAFVTMLALSAHQTCEKPLRVFIALHVIRVAVAYPVSFYNAIAPPSRPPRGEEDTPESRERREARRVIGNPRLDARLRTAADLIALFSFVWFFLGNVWLYSGGQCRVTSPYMWYSTLAILIIAYIRVAELVIIVLAVVFFLPLVIIVLRLFGGLEKKHEIGPLTKEEIAKLPVVYYIPAPEATDKEPASTPKPGEGHSEKPSDIRTDHAAPSEPASASQGDLKTPIKSKRRRHLLRILFKRKRGARNTNDMSKAEEGTSNGVYAPTKYPLHPLPDNLSSCPICLSDYEPPPLLTAPPEERVKALKELEPLTLLPCGHSIHKDCLAPWLQTSGRCPVCQRAVLGEEGGKQKKTRLGLRRRRRRQQQRQTANVEEDLERGSSAPLDTPAATAASAAASAPPPRQP